MIKSKSKTEVRKNGLKIIGESFVILLIFLVLGFVGVIDWLERVKENSNLIVFAFAGALYYIIFGTGLYAIARILVGLYQVVLGKLFPFLQDFFGIK